MGSLSLSRLSERGSPQGRDLICYTFLTQSLERSVDNGSSDGNEGARRPIRRLLLWVQGRDDGGLPFGRAAWLLCGSEDLS